jgi:1-deoxy-D-xylulose-5-phosphate synthase
MDLHITVPTTSLIYEQFRIIISAPKDEDELRHLLYTAIMQRKSPFAIRYPRGAGIGLADFTPFHEIPVGTWSVEKEKGNEILILAVGTMVQEALNAFEQYVKSEHSEPPVTIVNCRYVKPLDEKFLHTNCLNVRHIITVEENSLMGGFGEAISSFLSDKSFSMPSLTRLGISDNFVSHGDNKKLLSDLGLSADSICGLIKKIISGQHS